MTQQLQQLQMAPAVDRLDGFQGVQSRVSG